MKTLSRTLRSFALIASLSIPAVSSRAEIESQIETHHPLIESVTLFASNPEIVTPIGVAVAPDGRVFVQENHTHKRGKDYAGPEKDRILVFEDVDGDGVAEKRSVFHDGLEFTTDLLFGPDGDLYVATRWFIGRFR
ncbi:MAG: cytochrome C, partial [Verrucomicrobiota bacterium]